MKKLTNIIFTRNRPLQFEACLRSFNAFVPSEITDTIVLYKKEMFDEQYEQLFKENPYLTVIREENFHSDFCNLINRISTEYINFCTDDVVHYDGVEWDLIDQTFESHADDIFGFSLRLCPELISGQDDKYNTLKFKDHTFYQINWKKAQGSKGNHPFILNATIYKTTLIKQIIRKVSKRYPSLAKIFPQNSGISVIIGKFIPMKHFLVAIHSFKNPNELESNCHKYCKRHKRALPYNTYFKTQCAVAIQVNTVQPLVRKQIVLQDYDIYGLNKKYIEGYRVDIEWLQKNRPTLTHVDEKYFRLAKA
jgi:hypothetical protein